MSLFLGLDVGTQGTKGLVVDAEAGRVLARASSGYELLDGLPPGCAEQHPATWVEAVGRVCAELRAAVDFACVRGVGVSGQQHGLVLLDENDEVVRPAKLWCDTSTATEARELSERFGRSVPVGFTASKVLWVARQEPAHWARVRRVLLPHDYLNLLLCGRAAMEAGDASGTGFFDPEARAFRWDEVRAIDPRLEECLPPLLEAGALVGQVDERGAQLTGLAPGTPVSGGGGDNMMSAVGSGATEAGVVVCSLGTSGTLFTHADAPVIDPEGAIAAFCGSTGGWLPLLCVMNATGVGEEVRALTGQDYDALTAEAAQVEPGCDGLLWIPYLTGERVPDLPQATGSLLGMRPGGLQPGRLYRAALEGVSLNLAWGADRMRALGLGVDEVRLVGGAARNPLWGQILAACFRAPVRGLAEPESGALGTGVSPAHGWGLEKRLAYAEQLRTGLLPGGDYATRWDEAIETQLEAIGQLKYESPEQRKGYEERLQNYRDKKKTRE